MGRHADAGVLLTLGLAGWASARATGVTTIPSQAHFDVRTNDAGGLYPWRAYKSDPNTPPNLNITHRSGRPLADGYWFLGPDAPVINNTLLSLEQSAAYILDMDGDLVYSSGNISGTMGFQKQKFNGKDVLTFWNGDSPYGVNLAIYNGQTNIYDNQYNLQVFNPDLNINRVDKGFTVGEDTDCREQFITDRNTMVMLSYNKTQHDLTSVNGSADGWIIDNIVWEIDIATNKVLFQWSALDHIPITQSKQPFSNLTVLGNGTESSPWDYFHANAVSPVGDDHYLVSARHTLQFLYICKKTGKVNWTFQGQDGGDFGAPLSGQDWRWAHDLRAHNVTSTGMDISFLDNHNKEQMPQIQDTRAKVYHLVLPPNKSVSPPMTRQIYTPSEVYYSGSQGSYDPTLSNGNQLMYFGQIAILREYGPGATGGDLRYQAQFGGLNKVFSYRVYKDTWHATPAAWNPKLVVEAGRAYVSWNGATDVTEWNVYAGKKNGSAVTLVAVAKRVGFETTFAVPAGVSVLQLGAVVNGTEVRRSNVVRF